MTYDFIIVGGGMSGISVGHFLRDKKILILERGNLLAGATGNNAGFMISGFGEHYTTTVARNGRARASEIQQIHLRSHAKIRELVKQLNDRGPVIDPPLHAQTGSFSVPQDETEFHQLKQSYDLLKEDGFNVEWVNEINTGLKQSSGALLNRDDSVLDSPHFWSRLASELPVRTQCEVLEIENRSSSIRLHTTAGIFEAETVVFCLNAFLASLVQELDGFYIPLRGQMLELPLKKQPPTQSPIIMNYGEIYWRFTDQSLNFGGLEYRIPEEETGIATAVSNKIVSVQLDWIHEFMDHNLFLNLEPQRTWCSTMAFTVDGFPIVGPLERRGCYVLAGLCGLGHSYALECAHWLAELMVNGRNIIPEFCSSDRMKNLQRFAGGDWRNQYEAWNHGIH